MKDKKEKIINENYLSSLIETYLQIGIFSPSYFPNLEEIQFSLLKANDINSIVEEYGTESWYYSFSNLKMEELLINYSQENISSLNNYYKIFTHEISKFTKFFFHPNYDSIEIRQEHQFFTIEIYYGVKKYNMSFSNETNIYAALLELFNHILEKINSDNPMFYTIELSDGYKIVSLTRENFNLLDKQNFLTFSKIGK